MNELRKVTISAAFRKQIHGKMDVSDEVIDAVLKLFNGTLQPEIAKNYLSHLKSAIEDKINERLKDGVIKELTGGSTGVHEAAVRLIRTGNVRPFTILFKPMPAVAPKATTRLRPGGAIVFYLENLDPRQIRVLLAHELGHIALSMLGSRERGHSESNANLFGLIAIYDKSQFYRHSASRFSYGTTKELLDEFEMLCLEGIN